MVATPGKHNNDYALRQKDVCLLARRKAKAAKARVMKRYWMRIQPVRAVMVVST